MKAAKLSLVAALCAVSMSAMAQGNFEPFVVRDFRVEGNQSILDGTIYNYLPINIGDTVDPQRVREAMRALYGTEFFQDIEFRRDGDTLVIAVLERPTIAEFTFDGNKDFKDEDLEKMLQQTDLAAGKMFDRSMLDELTTFLTDEYYGRGKYAADIEATVEDLPDNRVRVHIEIEEGDRAKIREINIVGNTVFDDDTLLDQLELSTGNWLSKFRKNNLYSKETLQGDLETLQSYYMDRGYADFRVSDVQVSISPDKTDIFISISVEEGDVYTVRSVDLAGNMVVPEEVLRLFVYAQPGQEFSQQLVTYSEEDIKLRLGRDGYAFAEVQTVPELDRETKEVDLTIFVDPRSRIYVRRIDFTGAENANDEVFRREVRQLEGAILSNELLDLSQQRLQRLAYVEEVEYETKEVPGSLDLVDVEFDIKEGLPGSMSGNIGYSESQGIILGGQFSHANFLGTGNRVSLDLNGGKYYKVYGFTFTEPYRNMNGLSRQVSLTYQDITQFSSVTSDFSTQTIAAGMTWGLPINEVQTLRLGWSFNKADLLTSDYSSAQARQWVQENGAPYVINSGFYTFFGTEISTVDLIAGWNLERRNRTLFPDLGMRVSLNLQVTLPGSDVEYFTTAFNAEKFFRLPGQWRVRINSEINFGDAFGDKTTALPPFRNFYGGGPFTVRGFKESYLGPRDNIGNPNGGNLLFANQIELMVPTPEKFGNTARMAMFYDFGNVFHTGGVDFYDLLGDKLDTSFSFDKLKRSYGFGVQWLSPMGLLQFSYAVPLNADKQTDRFYADQTEGFQFTIKNAF